ncbi:hypothetical protein CC79DRAFT_1277918 [Sarocladium strictum]
MHPNAQLSQGPVESVSNVRLKQAEAIIEKARGMAASPIESPYTDKFGTLGNFTRSAREWVQFLDEAPESEDTRELREAVEAAITNLYPFLSHSPRHPGSTTPFRDLRASFEAGSRGIVVPTGKGTMRWAAHLISALQDVLGTRLPILVVYAGEQDFPADDRGDFQSRFVDVDFMDILLQVDDSTLKLGDGGWAIKAFAALYAPYQEIILLDADCVFVQSPEVLFDDTSYVQTGALLFHDRLLWQHARQDRLDWWRSQVEDPSPALKKSLCWTEGWSEEEDSGVVVLNKSRLDVLMGLLHTSWQNSKAVRDEVTYRMSYGDKETFWFGLELSGARYAFEDHYGGMVGWPHAEQPTNENEDKICSFYIAHVDSDDELLWYNGSLLKFKRGSNTTDFGIPTHLMMDGKWHKDGSVEEESCMDEKTASKLSDNVLQVLDKTIAAAKEVDQDLKLV